MLYVHLIFYFCLRHLTYVLCDYTLKLRCGLGNEIGRPANTHPLVRHIAFVVSCWKPLWYDLWQVTKMA